MARAPVENAKSGMRRKDREEEEVVDAETEEDEQPKRSAKSARDADDEDDRPSAKNGKQPRQRDEDDDQGEEREAREDRSSKKQSRRHDDDDGDGDGDDDNDTIDLSSADEDATFNDEVMPNGDYLCAVAETEFTEFKSGNKGIKVKLEVVKGDFAKGPKRKRGRVLYTNVVMSKAGADLLKTALKALGVKKDVYNSRNFSSAMLQRIADEGDLLGNEVVAKVRMRVYEGNKRNEVRGMRKATERDGDEAEGSGQFMDD